MIVFMNHEFFKFTARNKTETEDVRQIFGVDKG